MNEDNASMLWRIRQKEQGKVKIENIQSELKAEKKEETEKFYGE